MLNMEVLSYEAYYSLYVRDDDGPGYNVSLLESSLRKKIRP